MPGTIWISSGRLHAWFSNTATPSPPVVAVGGCGPALYTGLLSMGTSSDRGSPVKRFSNFTFVALHIAQDDSCNIQRNYMPSKTVIVFGLLSVCTESGMSFSTGGLHQKINR